MIYDITSIKLIQLDKTVFPPTVDLKITIKNNTEKILPIILQTSLYLGGSSDHYFVYHQYISPPLGEYIFDARLVLEHVSFLKAKEALSGADPFRITVKTNLITESGIPISNKTESFDIDKTTWILAQQEESKPRPAGVGVSLHFITGLDERLKKLEDKISEVKESILGDPVFQLQQKVFQNQINEIKNYLINQEEFKELSLLKPVMDLSNSMKIDHKWAIAASILSSLEGFMKKWLVQNASESFTALKKKEFEELIDKMKNALKTKGISFEQKKLSDLAGKRHFRNQVIHEMYVPTEGEITEITRESIDFVNYIESLKS